jgi:ribonuclease HI
MEIAVVARGVTYLDLSVGEGDNNDAEWLALIHGVRVAQTLGARDFVLLGDSALVVHQANGVWRAKRPALQHHLDAFKALTADLGPVRVRKIGRAQNLAGIALEKARWAPAKARWQNLAV